MEVDGISNISIVNNKSKRFGIRNIWTSGKSYLSCFLTSTGWGLVKQTFVTHTSIKKVTEKIFVNKNIITCVNKETKRKKCQYHLTGINIYNNFNVTIYKTYIMHSSFIHKTETFWSCDH